MKCEHNDCFTCPYGDCISDVEVEPERKKRGRKKLPPEEKAKRKALRNHLYYEKHSDRWRNDYYEKSEGKVSRRYKVKSKNLVSNTA